MPEAAAIDGGNGDLAGQVRVFKLSRGAWAQVGQNINGEAAGDKLGWSVAMSADGRTVAVGAPGSRGNGENAGQVRVFRLSEDVWAQVGQDINGEAAGDKLGWSVAMSADGRTVAVGAPGYEDNRSKVFSIA
mmetsp:Transcript_25268/g.70855  ORF Transcript_25268/g.70855 Transcript_25268/m.70855 type:complete len:132 (+) Transcript_25268:449-844(+)